MSKKIKKACVAAALAALVGVSAGVSACGTSKHPNARITIEFNEKTYVIDYMLYRNMYPQTVQHFIELADDGFYNDTIIHDYKSTDWVGGAYDYDDDSAFGYSDCYSRTDGMHEYLTNHCKEEAYYNLVTEGIKSGKFSASVFTKSIYDSKGNEILSADYALPTVIGEFADNDHKIKDDKGLTASFGTLKMFYYNKTDKQVVMAKNSFDQILNRDYSKNCATSLFSMQVSASSIYSAEKYATFGQLKNNKSRDVLEELTTDITDYVTEVLSGNKFTTSIATQVDKLDRFATESGRDIDVTFTMTSMPIIIRSVKITKH